MVELPFFKREGTILIEASYTLPEISEIRKLFINRCTFYYTICHLSMTLTRMISIGIYYYPLRKESKNMVTSQKKEMDPGFNKNRIETLTDGVLPSP
jgi:hypothetical protein